MSSIPRERIDEALDDIYGNLSRLDYLESSGPLEKPVLKVSTMRHPKYRIFPGARQRNA
ncbi:MAG TPA: hypothetical protein VJ574_03340 [Candidatus Bathyarchaeia archaeon]|nr:hypothetical protein [Candidatus Bathyarchaeia archaeon]